MNGSPASPALEVRNLTKQFPGVLALDGVAFVLAWGEIHALVGQTDVGYLWGIANDVAWQLDAI